MPDASVDITLRVRRPSTPTKLTEIVTDILKQMSETDKAAVIDTAEEDLIQFHNGWGMGIRNGYNLWHDKALVKALGAEHPDDASMVIIRAVWTALRESETT